MGIVGKVGKWWNERNAVPEEKTKMLNERIARLFPDPAASETASREEQEEKEHDAVAAGEA